MELNIDKRCNTPQFGMAHRISASRQDKLKFLKYIGEFNFSSACRKGLNQFLNESMIAKRYDTFWDPKTKAVKVIDTHMSDRVVKTFPYIAGETGLDHPMAKKYFGRKILAFILNPKEFLPKNLYDASEFVTKLEKLN